MNSPRVRWIARLFAAGALGAAGAACSFLTSLDGLSGGAGDAGIDAPSVPAVHVDSGSSGGTDAAPSGDDANADAPLDADAADARASFCASLSPAPSFCDDFDEDPSDAAALAAPWDQVTGLGGSVRRTDASYVSPPLSMAVATTADAQAVDLAGYKTFKTSKTTGQFVLSFDLFLQSADTTANSDAVLSAIEMIDAFGSRWALQLESNYDGDAGAVLVNFSENLTPGDAAPSQYIAHRTLIPLPIGAWTHVTMSTTIKDATGGPGAGNNAAALTVGATGQAKITTHLETIDGYPEILVGATYVAPSSAGWTILIDDVTFTHP